MKYSAYGVCLDSAFELTGLPNVSGNETSTIRLRLKEICSPCETNEKDYRENLFHGRRVFARSGREPCFKVESVGVFRIMRGERLISCQVEPRTSGKIIRYWLLRYFVPLYLAMEGQAMLFHGSAVTFGRGAVAFFAESFGGKSTLVNFLCQRGHSLITDDDLRVDELEGFWAVPSIPFVRAYRAQEDLGVQVNHFDNRPEPLRKVYVLELSDSPARVVPLAGGEAASMLLQHHRFRLIERMAERFRFSVRVSADVPIARLIVPRDLSRLPEVYETLLMDLEGR